MRLIVLLVVVKEAAVDHDRVVVLGDLVSIGRIGVHIMLSIKLDERRDSAAKRERAADGFVEAVLVKHGQHPRNAVVAVAYARIGFRAFARV